MPAHFSFTRWQRSSPDRRPPRARTLSRRASNLPATENRARRGSDPQTSFTGHGLGWRAVRTAERRVQTGLAPPTALHPQLAVLRTAQISRQISSHRTAAIAIHTWSAAAAILSIRIERIGERATRGIGPTLDSSRPASNGSRRTDGDAVSEHQHRCNKLWGKPRYHR